MRAGHGHRRRPSRTAASRSGTDVSAFFGTEARTVLRGQAAHATRAIDRDERARHRHRPVRHAAHRRRHKRLRSRPSRRAPGPVHAHRSSSTAGSGIASRRPASRPRRRRRRRQSPSPEPIGHALRGGGGGRRPARVVYHLRLDQRPAQRRAQRAAGRARAQPGRQRGRGHRDGPRRATATATRRWRWASAPRSRRRAASSARRTARAARAATRPTCSSAARATTSRRRPSRTTTRRGRRCCSRPRSSRSCTPRRATCSCAPRPSCAPRTTARAATPRATSRAAPGQRRCAASRRGWAWRARASRAPCPRTTLGGVRGEVAEEVAVASARSRRHGPRRASTRHGGQRRRAARRRARRVCARRAAGRGPSARPRARRCCARTARRRRGRRPRAARTTPARDVIAVVSPPRQPRARARAGGSPRREARAEAARAQYAGAPLHQEMRAQTNTACHELLALRRRDASHVEATRRGGAWRAAATTPVASAASARRSAGRDDRVPPALCGVDGAHARRAARGSVDAARPKEVREERKRRLTAAREAREAPSRSSSTGASSAASASARSTCAGSRHERLRRGRGAAHDRGAAPQGRGALWRGRARWASTCSTRTCTSTSSAATGRRTRPSASAAAGSRTSWAASSAWAARCCAHPPVKHGLSYDGVKSKLDEMGISLGEGLLKAARMRGTVRERTSTGGAAHRSAFEKQRASDERTADELMEASARAGARASSASEAGRKLQEAGLRHYEARDVCAHAQQAGAMRAHLRNASTIVHGRLMAIDHAATAANNRHSRVGAHISRRGTVPRPHNLEWHGTTQSFSGPAHHDAGAERRGGLDRLSLRRRRARAQRAARPRVERAVDDAPPAGRAGARAQPQARGRDDGRADLVYERLEGRVQSTRLRRLTDAETPPPPRREPLELRRDARAQLAARARRLARGRGPRGARLRRGAPPARRAREGAPHARGDRAQAPDRLDVVRPAAPHGAERAGRRRAPRALPQGDGQGAAVATPAACTRACAAA